MKINPSKRELTLTKNKAGYTAIKSRTVGQEQYCENRKNVTDGRTDGPTDQATRQGVESRVRD